MPVAKKDKGKAKAYEAQTEAAADGGHKGERFRVKSKKFVTITDTAASKTTLNKGMVQDTPKTPTTSQ